jgi:hypothetical protein
MASAYAAVLPRSKDITIGERSRADLFEGYIANGTLALGDVHDPARVVKRMWRVPSDGNTRLFIVLRAPAGRLPEV